MIPSVDDQKASAVFGSGYQTCTSLYRFDSTFCKQQNVLLNGTTTIRGGTENITETVNDYPTAASPP